MAIIDYLGRHDSAKAAVWGAAHVDEIQHKASRFYSKAQLGTAIAEVNPQLANTIFEQLLPLKDGAGAEMYGRVCLVQLAAKLGRPEARILVDETLDILRAVNKDGQPQGNAATLIGVLAEADVGEAMRVLNLLEENQRCNAVQRMIEALTRHGGKANIYAAQKLVESSANSINDRPTKRLFV